jgi:hypothetical protein
MSDERRPSNTGRITINGPLILQGRIRHPAPDGARAVEYTHVALCRCGGSGGERSGTNSGGATSNGGISTPEPSDESVALPMF